MTSLLTPAQDVLPHIICTDVYRRIYTHCVQYFRK